MQVMQKKSGSVQMKGNSLALSVLVAAILVPSILKDLKVTSQEKLVQELSVKKSTPWMWNHGK